MKENTYEVLAYELCATLIEIDSKDKQAIFKAIANKVKESFDMGYNEGLEDSLSEIKELTYAINSLKLKDKI